MANRCRSPLVLCLRCGVIVAVLLSSNVAAQPDPAPSRRNPPPHPELAMIHVPEGFVAEKLYEVPPDEQGSWVTMTPSADGGLIASDQYGGFYQVTLPTNDAPIHVQRLEIDLGMAQGLLVAFDSLYAVVNHGARSGLYRAGPEP